ncbi:class I SAM-dependent methyltransferase [Alteribacter natronophilus]|uniref:class I SAM-dependent methyltransferase n=1 Tax=Alteribacter natronophilus TaxID=2583810 RepID=UPI00110F34AC|nr:class I SAM-dependent methyltransferase [Alteribacter natronophilus]TMW70103.1 class I SAM-dependent methyltransferase [Alteribacter natronophilus]
MGINFHDPANRETYAAREADRGWYRFMRQLLNEQTGFQAVDIGCGGGIYTRALADLGASRVTGVDYSEASLEGAGKNTEPDSRIAYVLGHAENTGLKERAADVVLIRAVIHHLGELDRTFREAFRLLRPGGLLVIQDRTPEDCLLPGSSTHIRGWFFSCFPKLVDMEKGRRWPDHGVRRALEKTGFRMESTVHVWETRREYETKERLLEDLSGRTGRSLLHELDDRELKILIDYIDRRIEAGKRVAERDRWTIWAAVKGEEK